MWKIDLLRLSMWFTYECLKVFPKELKGSIACEAQTLR